MEHVRIEDDGTTQHVVIQRAQKRNALSSEVYTELGAAFEAAATDAGVRCVVVRGDGPLFSAGNDVVELAGVAADPSAIRRGRPVMLAAVNALETMTKPTIAQIHGACIGGAAELAMACDFRVLADDAIIGMYETKLGLIPDLGGSSRLPALVGLGRAKEIVMTARTVGAAEALAIGLVTRVGPAGELDALTGRLIAELSANGPVAVGQAKRILDAAAHPALATTLELEVSVQDTLARTEDFQESAAALLAKRPAVFVGR
jgi:enoyl-CoA hydratase/carnithine racemase